MKKSKKIDEEKEYPFSLGEGFIPLIKTLCEKKPSSEKEVRNFLRNLKKIQTELEDSRTTEKKQQKELQEQEQKCQIAKKEIEKFKYAVESITDQIIITDKNGIILYTNPAMEKVTGFLKEDVLGKKAGSPKLGGGLMPKEYYKNMWNTIIKEKKTFYGEITNMRKNGEKYISQISISPIFDDAKKIQFFVTIRHDISKYRKAEEIKNRFISVASHEMRTPMTIIRGFISFLLEEKFGKINEKQRTVLEKIIKNTASLLDLINDMLDISKLEAGKTEFNNELFCIQDLLENTVSDFQSIALKKNQSLTFHSSTKTKRNVFADERKIKRVLINLLGNSLKFTPQRGTIEISLSPSKKYAHYLEVAIRDTGIGIPLEDQDTIFEKFYRTKSKKINQKYEGTGLGLAITEEIIKKTGGKIWLKSKPNKGTTFFFTLPTSHEQTRNKTPHH
jgi:PAS domain S-box-containing protein